MTESTRVIAALQENSAKLIEENWIDAWGLRTAADEPVKLSLQHTIHPEQDGSYRIKSSVVYGIRVSRRVETELAKAADRQNLATFPRGNVSAAA